MEIAFDPVKDAINRDKHGVSLAFGERDLGQAPLQVVEGEKRVPEGDADVALRRGVGQVALQAAGDEGGCHFRGVDADAAQPVRPAGRLGRQLPAAC